MGTDNRVVSLAARKAEERAKKIEQARAAYRASKSRKDAQSVQRRDLVFADRERC